MSSHWQFWAGGIYKGAPHKSKEPSFMSKQWTLVRKWDQIFFVLFFRAFLTLPKYNTPCPPFLGHFLLLGRGDHSSSVCVSTSSEKGGSACRCPQYGWKCLSLLVWAFFLHPLLLLSTHADKFTDRVSFLCLGTGSIAVCSGPLFYPLSPLENESLCQKAAWNMMQSLRPQQSLRLYHHMRWRLKRFFIHHKTYSICWTWVDVMTGGKYIFPLKGPLLEDDCLTCRVNCLDIQNVSSPVSHSFKRYIW